MTENEPRIFLCHASDDKAQVRELYHQLKAAGYHPWLDEEDLLPGQNWRAEIRRIITDPNNLVLVCLSSNSVTKRGTVQREIKWALDTLEEMPEDTIYLIPARLEDCQAPDRLSDLHWVDLFKPDGFERLKRSLDSETIKQKSEVRPRPIRQAADVLPLNEWPQAAQVVNKAGKYLQMQLGEELITAEDISQEIVRVSEFARGSLLPADYCYNRINKAPYSFRFPVFQWVERGKYRYLGPGYDYTGPILWKPRGKPERKVGEWKSGVCRLWEDPRNDWRPHP